MRRKKSAEFSEEPREKKSTPIILVKVLIYTICAFAVATSGLTRISEANSLVGSTAYTVTTSYGQVISGGSTDSVASQQAPMPNTADSSEQPSVVTGVAEPAQTQYPAGVDPEQPDAGESENSEQQPTETEGETEQPGSETDEQSEETIDSEENSAEGESSQTEP